MVPRGWPPPWPRRDGGARQFWCDEQEEIGGSLLAETGDDDRRSVWLERPWRGCGRRVRTLLPRTTAFGWFRSNFIGLAERVTDHLADPPASPRERLWQVRAKRGGVWRRARSNGRWCSAQRSSGYHAGRRGARLPAPLGGEGWRPGRGRNDRLTVPIAPRGRSARGGVTIVSALRIRGRMRDAARDLPVSSGATLPARRAGCACETCALSDARADRACDTVLMAGGWTPSVHLFSQSRGQAAFRCGSVAVPAGIGPPAINAPGPAAACSGFDACIEEGMAAGEGGARPAMHRTWRCRPAEQCPLPPAGTSGNGLRRSAERRYREGPEQATREGFRSIEHVKRYTTAGMATDQGKTSNLNALATVADAARRGSRSRAHDVPHALHAGDVRHACRRSARRPVRAGAADADACMGRGAWRGVRGCRRLEARALLSPQTARTQHAAVARECRAVRNAVGVFDGQARSARSKSSGRTPRNSSTVIYTNRRAAPGAGALPLRPDAERERLRDGRRRDRRGSRPTGSMSPPRPAARRTCCTTWRTIGRPSSPICASG